jgi:protease-4
MFSPKDAQVRGLVDTIAFPDELEAQLGLDKHPALPAHRYLKRRQRKLFVPLREPARQIALVRLAGPIGSGPNPRGIALAPTRSLLRRLKGDRRIAGVILHIDSPGGSAVASELLHREITLLDAEKPVVAWLGDVAASGGYYLAVATRHIVARATTITGSIGVISARPVATRLLEHAGVRPEVVKLSPHADFHSLRAADPHETALILAETQRYYRRFLDVVAEGRKRPLPEIEQHAEGRVWSGVDAQARGLVDELGGYEQARAALDGLLAGEARGVALEPVLLEPASHVGASGQPALATLSWLGTAALQETTTILSLLPLLEEGERILAYEPLANSL